MLKQDINERALIGYAKLAEAVVLTSVRPSESSLPKNNLKFAYSRLLHHYCDVFNYPIEKIRKRIIEINNNYEPTPKPYKQILYGKITAQKQARAGTQTST